MKLPQWIKKPLRLVGLGAEPKDSTPLQLTQEIQRVLSIPCGVDRQTLIPMKGNKAGGIEIMPLDLSNAEIEVGYGYAAGYEVFAKTADILELYVHWDIPVVTYRLNGVDVTAIPLWSCLAYNSAGETFMGAQAYRIAGPISGFTIISPMLRGFIEYYYNAIRFKHGREQ